MTSSIRARVAAPLLTTCLIGALLALAATPAGAVTVNDEAGFRAAWTNAAETEIVLGADITFSNCGAGEPTRNSATALTVVGNGHTLTQTCANQRVLRQDGGGGVTLENLTVTGGTTPGNGAGILSVGGDVTLTNVVVTGNTAQGAGSGVRAFDATITGSTITGNTAVSFSGAVFTEGLLEVTDSQVTNNTNGPDNGGGLRSNGDVVVTRSLVSGNTTGGNGGGAHGNGSVTVIDSTISGNTALLGGGLSGPSVSVVNSTISANTATGGGNNAGGIGAGSVGLVYATVVGNTASGVANVNAVNLTSFGSVIALAQGGGDNCGIAGGTTSNGYNFSDDSTCGFTGTADRQGAGDPVLGALADNGGPTPTRLPGAGSPLIDGVPGASCRADGAAGITADQRGVTRPQGASCDIGAVEVEMVVLFTG